MTPEELAVLKTNIADAEAAYQALMTGQQVKAWTDQNGERMEYSVATRPALYQYIQMLKAQLPADTCGAVAWPKPLRFNF